MARRAKTENRERERETTVRDRETTRKKSDFKKRLLNVEGGNDSRKP